MGVGTVAIVPERAHITKRELDRAANAVADLISAMS
jgi:hypothetical protein